MSKAPDSAIQMGYMLEKAERKYIEYLWQALECMKQGVIDIKADGKELNLLDLHQEREILFQAMANAQEIKRVHKRLAKVCLELGYDKPTDQDFGQFGAGTNR